MTTESQRYRYRRDLPERGLWLRQNGHFLRPFRMNGFTVSDVFTGVAAPCRNRPANWKSTRGRDDLGCADRRGAMKGVK